MTVIVRIENLSKEYIEGHNIRAILRSASATFEEGEFVAIRGRSGSGKSTLLNLLAGIDSPTSGEILVATTDDRRQTTSIVGRQSSFINITKLSPRDRTLFRRDNIGFVFQFFNLIPTLTVLENVLLPAELAGAQLGNGTTKRALELLDRVGLADRRSVFPDKLSGGEQQRVAIARALVRNPRLVLADEPTGNLDDANAKAVMALLSEMTHQAGKTLIMVTHSRKMAALADRVLTIEEGKIVEKQEA
ncbi:MAG TPA: ABC transporter ATP-binding protein [Anaerolineales bacterium]|nr:ABC transporter ATP-binding protein [Anaerolineales bacterium]